MLSLQRRHSAEVLMHMGKPRQQGELAKLAGITTVQLGVIGEELLARDLIIMRPSNALPARKVWELTERGVIVKRYYEKISKLIEGTKA